MIARPGSIIFSTKTLNVFAVDVHGNAHQLTGEPDDTSLKSEEDAVLICPASQVTPLIDALLSCMLFLQEQKECLEKNDQAAEKHEHREILNKLINECNESLDKTLRDD